MSRTGLHRPRRYRAVCHRPATGTRLLPSPHSRLDHSLGWGIPLALSRVEACPEPRRRGSQERNRRGLLPSPPHLNTHYKRCPKALRLRLRSDLSPSRPLHGRFPDKSRHALSKGHCQVRAPLTRRIRFASSGDALEHSVMSLPRAIAPPWATAPFPDSTVVTTGELPTTNAGHGSPLPSLGVVEHFWWTRLPHSETSSRLLHILSEVRGKDSTVVTIGELRSTNAGLGSTLPSLRMVEHFWWSRPPHSEISSLLLHVPSEVRGCRRVVADVKRPQGRTPRIATGVADILRKRPGPSITSPFSLPFRGSARNLGLAHSPISALSTPSPRGACPPEADHFQLASGCKRTVRLGTVHLKRSVKPSPGQGIPLALSGVEGSQERKGWPTTANSSHPSPTTHERTRLLPHTPTISPARSKENVVFLQNNQKSRLSPHINQTSPSPHPRKEQPALLIPSFLTGINSS